MMGGHPGWWATLVLLGAFHGINPAMGWLFAVALGLQEQRRAAVWRALLPLGVGHALAIVAVLVVALLAGVTVPLQYLRWLVAATLIILGVRWWFRHPHPRWVGMRVGMADLTLWSFLVASVHGAGLMVLPVFLGMTGVAPASGHHHLASGAPATALMATALHAASYLLVTASIALLVFDKLGLAMLRKAWFNLDYLWAAALVGTGAATLVM